MAQVNKPRRVKTGPRGKANPDIAESIRRSRERRAAMIKRFGFMPESVLKLSRGPLSKKVFVYQQENPMRSTQKSPGNIRKRSRFLDQGVSPSLAIMSGGNGEHGRKGATIMPAELVEFFLKYYLDKGDVYLDPFMGQGVQLQVARLYEVDYIGYDISKEFFSYIESVIPRLAGKSKIEVHCKDARHMDDVPDGSCGFCFTSPPYWDIEYYGDEPEQLGRNTYDEFLKGMHEVAAELFRKMKIGGVAVINVNDFRKKGKYYPYHSDTITLFRRAGWTMHDTWIIEGLVGGLPRAFAVDKNSQRIAPKIHEYALVFAK